MANDELVITINSEENDDWIRSPQVTKGHPSDAELFGKPKPDDKPKSPRKIKVKPADV